MAKGLNSNQLKLIAVAAMTLDHLAWTFYPGYSRLPGVVLLHLIGRIAAPIMWYFIAEGYHHTRNLQRYTLRLFGLAVISHFAYNFCFGIPFLPFQTSVFNQTSVIWPLAWGLMLLRINDSTRYKDWQKILLTLFVCAITFPSDWSCIAAMAIFFIGANRGNFKAQMGWMLFWTAVYSVVYFLFLDPLYGFVQLGTCLAIPILRMYNGQRGACRAIGKLFYFYYPAHLILCGILRIVIP